MNDFNDSNNPNFSNNDGHNVQVIVHEERIKWIIDSEEELKKRVSKLESRYDVLYEMVSSIKTLAVQVGAINDNFTAMKSDIGELKDQQSELSSKLSTVENDTKNFSDKKSKKENMADEIVMDAIKFILVFFLAILLATLFPHLKEFV